MRVPPRELRAEAHGAPATLAEVGESTQLFNRKERWVPIELLGPMKVTARKTQRVLDLRCVTMKVTL